MSTQDLTAVTDRDDLAASPAAFEACDWRGASRQSALTLAREARALPNEIRWVYLRALREAARRDELLQLETGEHPLRVRVLRSDGESGTIVFPGSADLELAGKLRLETVTGDAFELRAPVRARRRGRAHVGIRRGLPAFAFAGVLAGITAAVLLPSSLSEKLPGTSGNGNEGASSETAGKQGGAGALQQGPRSVRPGGSRFSSVEPVLPRSSSSRPNKRSRRSRSKTSGSSHPKKRSSASRPSRRIRHQVAIGRGTFSGQGDMKLGTLRIDRPTILSWSTGGQSFRIASEAWRFRPRQRRGSTVLTPGTYRGFAVKAATSWKLSLNRAR